MKVALLGDIHFGVYNSDEQFFKFQISVLDKLFDGLKERGISDVVLSGDFFDNRKVVQWKLAYDAKEYMKSKTKDFKFYYISGNHDLVYKNDNSINSFKILFEDVENFYIVNDVAEEVMFDSVKFLMIPWLNENSEKSFKQLMTTDAKFAVGHLEMKGFQWVKGIESEEGLDIDLFGNFTKVFSGHFHIESEKANIKYLGSVYQLSWNDFDTRKIYTIFDTETKTWEDVEIGNYIFEKIYDVKAINVSDFKGKFVKVYITDTDDSTESKLKELSEVAYKVEIYNISEETETIEEEFKVSAEGISENMLISHMVTSVDEWTDIRDDIFNEIAIIKSEVE